MPANFADMECSDTDMEDDEDTDEEIHCNYCRQTYVDCDATGCGQRQPIGWRAAMVSPGYAIFLASYYKRYAG